MGFKRLVRSNNHHGLVSRNFLHSNRLADLLTEVLPLMMVISWIYTFSETVKGIVVEKQERVKEVLAVMGVGRGVQSAGWVLEGVRGALLTCIVLSLLLKVSTHLLRKRKSVHGRHTSVPAGGL